eukprot:GFUD01014636.1.p1 GENE.GFUD01014636.1~~GFUD01014636.1.p1  ORF type:complete len:102 (+),score=20.66 GFUD01014636.1:201-506(+)
MKLGPLLIFVIGIILIDPSFGRPEEGEENLVSRLKRGLCCHCVCSGRKKRSEDGQEIDHEMTKRFAPELELLSHYRNKRSPQEDPIHVHINNCCCSCHKTS